MSSEKNILMVVTSHAKIDSEHATGLWLEEFSVPYRKFRDAGYTVTVASPEGGQTPIDPRSLEDFEKNAENQAARQALEDTSRLDKSFRAADFAAIFFPGGHGTMFDLPDNRDVQRLIVDFLNAEKVVAAVCHGPACLVGAHFPDGSPVARGRHLTAFTDAEEREVELDQLMPFLLETRLRELGAEFVAVENWQDHVECDGRLITGQNPQSSASTAEEMLKKLESA